MNHYILVLVSGILVCQAVSGNDGMECIRELHELEVSVLSRGSNIDALTEAFFPVNCHESVGVEVYYHFTSSLNYSEKVLLYIHFIHEDSKTGYMIYHCTVGHKEFAVKY